MINESKIALKNKPEHLEHLSDQNSQEDLCSVLMNMGYDRVCIESIVKKIDSHGSLDQQIIQALSLMQPFGFN